MDLDKCLMSALLTGHRCIRAAVLDHYAAAGKTWTRAELSTIGDYSGIAGLRRYATTETVGQGSPAREGGTEYIRNQVCPWLY